MKTDSVVRKKKVCESHMDHQPVWPDREWEGYALGGTVSTGNTRYPPPSPPPLLSSPRVGAFADGRDLQKSVGSNVCRCTTRPPV